MLAFLKLLASLAFLPALYLFRAAITEVKTTVRPVDAEMLGAMPTQGNIVTLFNNLKANAAPVFGNWDLSEIASTLAADTYTAGAMIGGFIRRNSTGTTQDSVASGTNIVNAIPGAVVGQTFPVVIANMGSGTLTVGTNTGCTLAGTATIARFSTRLFIGEVTGSAAYTLTQCFSFGAANTTG
jgi:hypothetical protein